MLADLLIGNRSRLPFIPLLSLRSQLLFRRIPTALTILALAMSVALAASVEMSSRSVRTAVNKTADALVGDSDLEVTAGGQGIPEVLTESIRAVPHVERASPSIHQTFRVARGPAEGEAIRMIGIDFLQDRDVRDFSVLEAGVVVSDPLRLVARPNAILVPRAMADRLHLSEGSTLLLRGPRATDEFVVRGLLTGELTEAFGGQIAVMDVYGLQALTRLGGRVHRIDVSVAEGADLARVRSAIESIVGPGIAVRPPSLRQELRHSTMGVIDVSIWSLVVIATLLALLSTYAVVSLSVERRLEELALLRVAGMDGRRIALLIITDALLFAVVSTAIGLLIATFVADPLVSLLSQASQNLQRLRIDPLGLEPRTVAIAMVVGLPVALFASIEPAIRVSRGSPMEVLAGQRYAEHRSNLRGSLVVMSLLSAGLSAGAWYWREMMPPPVRVFAVLGFAVLALGFGAGQIFALAIPRLRNAFGRLVPRIGHLVASMLMERTLETGMTVAVWAALVGGVVAMVTTIDGISASMDEYFSGWSGPEAILVFAEDPLIKSGRDRERLEPATVSAISSVPGLSEAVLYCDTSTDFRGTSVAIYNAPSEVLERHGGLLGTFPNRQSALTALKRGDVVVSQTFSRRFGLRVGDEIPLGSGKRAETFRIGAIHSNFTGGGGSITMDDRVFHRLFADQCDSPSALAFWSDAPLPAIVDEIRERARGQALFFLDGKEYSSLVRRIVGRYRSLLLLPVILIGTAGLAVLTNLLLGSVIARRRDFSILRSTGGTAANVMSVILSQGIVIALVGTAIGLPLAAYWSNVIVGTIEDLMGWSIQASVRWGAALVVVGVAGLGSIGASVLPAWLGRRWVPTGATSSDL